MNTITSKERSRPATQLDEESSSKRPRSSLNEIIEAKVQQILSTQPTNPFLDDFRFIPEGTNHQAFIVRETEDGKEIGLMGGLIGEGSFATVHKVHILGSDQILAFKKRREGNTAADSLVSMNNECDVREIMESEEPIKGFPKSPYGYVYALPVSSSSSTSSSIPLEEEKELLGFLDEVYESDYAKKMENQSVLPLDFAQIGKEFTDIASALFNFHELEYVHRDIKPANFLCKDGQVHLTDFGNAKALDYLDSQDECDMVFPEPYTLAEDELNIRSFLDDLEGTSKDDEDAITEIKTGLADLHKSMDVFAAGSIFFERCYPGHKPYSDSDEDAPMAFDEDTEEPLLVNIPFARDLPEGLLDLISQMLSPCYQDRPTARAVFTRLEGIFNT